MFSKELENLIQATLEDGVLEENEKAALIKRAQNEGVDLAELEIYINSILQRRQRELINEKQKLAEAYKKEKKEAFGRVCPNCGKQIPPMTLKCECGYEFNKKEATSSSQQLMEQIGEISASKGSEGEKHERIMNAISMFPVPNTKEDIIEFLALSAPKSQKKGGFLGSIINRIIVYYVIFLVFVLVTFRPPEYGDDIIYMLYMVYMVLFILGTEVTTRVDKETLKWNKDVNVWRAKFDQVLMKGRSLRGDPEFQRQLDYYENQLNN